MHNPTVSFVIPCYKLAHLLPECVNSILEQTYDDFEVLIMDDCSPDNTADVAKSFRDPRIQHVRNDQNLGHLRNYNKGIGLSRSKYVWLISADDYLRRPYVLQRYVELMERYPRIGYTFCSGVAVGGGPDNRLKGWVSHAQSVHGNRDRIFAGHALLKKLLRGNTIVAASGLVRRECYDKLGMFPLDMPWAGDWYLWCLFAMHFDVGYFAEPMVCYRDHELSMTNKLWNEDGGAACCDEDLAIAWSIKRGSDGLGFSDVSRACLEAIAEIYVRRIVAPCYRMLRPALSLEQFESSLRRNSNSEKERNRVRARVFAGMANQYFWRGKRSVAKRFYNDSIKMDPWMLKVYAKRLLLSLGSPGDFFWKRLKHVRNKNAYVGSRETL